MTRVALIACTAVLAQCMDTDSLAPLADDGDSGNPPAYSASLVTCTGSTTSTVIQCSSDQPGSPLVLGSKLVSANNAFGSSSLVLPEGIIVGGQNTYVTLTSSNITNTLGVFGFDVTVQNLIPQAMGTNDGTTVTPEGVRVFFHQLPTVTGINPGTITVTNHDGTETFMSADQRYYQYNGILDPNETSASKRWEFAYTGNITFEFKVYVWAPVQYPDGWIIVTPSADQLEIPTDATEQLSGSVVSAVGNAVPAPPAIVWASTDEAVATVDNTGLVTAVGAGTTTITATAGTYEGSAEITVIGDVDHFLVEAAGGGNIGPQAAGVAFDIKITAQDAADQTVTGFTGTADLTSTPAGLNVTSGAFTAGVLASQSVTLASGGNYTITATRTGGTEAGTSNNFDVTAAAGAVADEVSGTSVPTDAYHTPLNTALSIPDGAQDLLANDNRGFPLANVSHFGAAQCNNGSGTLISATDLIDANGAGGTQNLTGVGGCTGGSLTVNADGTLTFTPVNNYTGLFRFQYRITNSAGTSDAQVTLAVGVRPDAVDDSYNGGSLIGNVRLDTNTGTIFTVSGNDAGDQRSVTLGTPSNGSVTLNANGTFTFNPNPGYTGAGGFTYSVTNGFGSDAGTLSLTVANVRIWFTDISVGASGTGTQASPFKNLSDLAAANVSGGGGLPQNNDALFIAQSGSGYLGALTLRPGQKLIGQDATQTLAEITTYTPATHQSLPTMNSGDAPFVNLTSGGLTIVLGSTNTLRGLTLGNATTTALTGNTFGTLTVANDVVINNQTGQALVLTTGSISGNFGNVFSNGGTNNIQLTSVVGTSNFGGGSLTGATTTAFFVNGGSGNFTYNGSISGVARPANIQGMGGGSVTLNGPINSTGGILVQNNSSSTITFSGGTKTLNTGATAAVTLATNAASVVTFSGGNLALTTTTAPAFDAEGGGTTLTVTGSGNTITTTGAATSALKLNSITVGVDGIAFSSVNAGSATTLAGVSLVNLAGASTSVSLGSVTVAGGAKGMTMTGNVPSISATPTINAVNGIGVELANNTGSVTLSAGAIGDTNDPAGNAVDIAGGSASVSIATPITKTTSNGVANVTGRSGGTVTFSGALSCTNGGVTTCTGINVTSNTGGTVEFTSGSKTLNIPGTQAVTFSSNTGNTTLAFTGGGLVITSTTAIGLLASNTAPANATLKVQGAGNTISSTSATALSVSNTTIGAPAASEGGLNFVSISSNGAASGILLNNTGATAGLRVFGTGSANSGGTIQSSTGDGVSLNSTRDVSLTSMNITNNAGSGVFGDEVTNFSITNSSVTNNDSDHPTNMAAGNDAGLRFNELYGTSAITGTTVSGTKGDNFRMEMASGTLTALNVSGSAFGPNPVGTGGNGFAIVGTGTSNITALINGASAFSGNQASGFLTTFANTAVYNITVQASTLSSNNIGFDFGIGGGSGSFNFSNNTVTNHPTQALNIISDVASTSASQVSAIISTNTINGTDGHGIAVDLRGGAGGAFRIDNNTVSNQDFYGVGFFTRLGNGSAHVKIDNNNISAATDPFFGAYAGIEVVADDARTVCLNVLNNTSVGTGGRTGIRTRQTGNNGPAIFRLHGFGGDGTNSATVGAFMQGLQDPGTTASVQTAGAGTIVSYTNGTCVTP